MKNLYNKNGLVFWSQEQIQLRRNFETFLTGTIFHSLLAQNSAFQMVQCEAPLLTPRNLINPGYTSEDIFEFDDLALRPETTMGSYEYAKMLLSGYHDVKYRAPLIVWQHGKSFRREQDQPSKHMRLKEFYQLEFQIIFSLSTGKDYTEELYRDMRHAIQKLVGPCDLELSDRLPDYSEETTDIVRQKNGMEVCSMSKRKDFEGYKVVEVAIGTDRLIYNHQDLDKKHEEEDEFNTQQNER